MRKTKRKVALRELLRGVPEGLGGEYRRKLGERFGQ